MTCTATLNSGWGTDALGKGCPQVVNDYPPVNTAGAWTGIYGFSQIGSSLPCDSWYSWFGQIQCDDATLDALKADSKYNGDLTVVSDDRDLSS